MQAEKAAFRPCACTEGALTHHGQTLVPGADRRHLRLEGGGRCVVEPLDYSTVRSSPPRSSCRKPARKARCGATCAARGLRRGARSGYPTPWMRGPSRPMRGLASERGRRHGRGSRTRVPACACRQGIQAACREKMPPRQQERL